MIKAIKRLLSEVFGLIDCCPFPGVIEAFGMCQCYAI
jgi:hypothetical protein